MRRNARGSALAETAMVLTTLLLVVLGVFRLGIVAYMQLGTEGTAWTLARQISLGDTLTNAQTNASAKIFRQIGSSDTTNTTANTPFMWMPLSFGSSSSVHGGVSLVLQNQQRLLTQHTGIPTLLKGGTVTTSAVSVEGTPMTRGLYFNVAEASYNASNYGSITNFSSAPSSSGESTPPYFVTTNYMCYCQISGTISTNLTTMWTPDGTTHRAWCPSGKGVYRPLGVAEYLDAKNWNNSPGGVTSSGAIFSTIACHQRYLAKAAQLIAALNVSVNSLSGGADVDSVKASMDASINGTDTAKAIATIYSWDYNGPYTGYSAGTSMNNSFPLTPTAGCPGPTS
jgi:hypothetical protein